MALRRSGWTLASIGNSLGVSTTRALQLVRKAERLSRNPHWYDALPARARTFLHNMDLAARPEIDAAHAVAQLSHRELMRAPNFGAGACAAVVAWLACHGLALQPESPRALRPIRNETSAPARGAPV